MAHPYYQFSEYRARRSKHEWLRHRLLALKKYQYQLAAAIGVNESSLSNWINGHTPIAATPWAPDEQQVRLMARFLDLPEDVVRAAVGSSE